VKRALLRRPRLLAFAWLALARWPSGSAAGACGEQGVAVQVLGSGGPIADDGRASSGYLVWIDGHARLLVDAGGGTFLRFGEAGASIADLDVICLTHLHTDHAADVPALLKGGYFSDRTRSLPIVGPTGRGVFPGTAAFLQRLFARMIRGADLLVMAHAIPQQAGQGARDLHATPDAIGRRAAEAQVHSLLLSHLMARSLAHLPESQAIIRRHYAGPLRVAEDLMCIDLGE